MIYAAALGLAHGDIAARAEVAHGTIRAIITGTATNRSRRASLDRDRGELSAWGGRERGFGALSRPVHPGLLFEQTHGDEPRDGRPFRRAESLARTFVAPPGERAMQHARGCEVKRLVVVSHAAGDLRGGDNPWSGRERVGVMSEALDGLAGGGEVPLEAAQGGDRSLERPSQPARELVCGARFVDAGEQRFDDTIVTAAKPVEVVGGTAPWKAGRGTGSVTQHAISAGIASG